MPPVPVEVTALILKSASYVRVVVRLLPKSSEVTCPAAFWAFAVQYTVLSGSLVRCTCQR